MPNDEDYRRLKRFILISWSIVLALIILIIAYFSFQVSALNSHISIVAGTKPTVVNGRDGKDGMDGKDGSDGNTTIINKNITTNIPIPGPTGQTGPVGAQGLQGQAGIASPQIIIKVDTATCQLESQYQGDDSWSILAQLPTPCISNSK